MDQALTLTLFILGVPCFFVLILLPGRAVGWGIGAGSAVFAAVCLAAILSDTSDDISVRIGVAAAEVAFLVVCPIWGLLLRHQEEEPAIVDPERPARESELRRESMTRQDWDRYRAPD